jgi:ubiquinone/menaquinone biosynthesis C-methylase UbiE
LNAQPPKYKSYSQVLRLCFKPSEYIAAMNSSTTSSADISTRIKSLWDHEALAYDLRPGHGKLSIREKRAWTQLLGHVLEPLQSAAPLRIADVGAGTGVMTILLADMGHSVTAVDLSPAMLEQARLKAGQVQRHIEFVEANATQLPMHEDSMDVVFSRHLFWTLPHPIETLREWTRVVRPGGMICIADGWWNEPTATMRRRRAAGKLMRRILRDEPSGHPGYDDLQNELPVAGGVSPYTIRYFLDQAGLERLRVRDLKTIRAAERRSRAPWYWIDQARFTWIATGYKPE